MQRYISKELCHFVGRGKQEAEQLELLIKIIKSGWLTHPPHDPTRFDGNLEVQSSSRLSTNEMYLPQMVCFCDIPIPDLVIHARKYGRFGLAFSKDYLVGKGATPVHYLAENARVRVCRRATASPSIPPKGSQMDYFEYTTKAEYFDRMMVNYRRVFRRTEESLLQPTSLDRPEDRESFRELEHFLDFHIFSYVKFFDHSLADDHLDNYYLEREWRVLGNVQFEFSDIVRVLLPSKYASSFRRAVPSYEGQLTFLD